MACLAAVAAPHRWGRVRRRSAHPADDRGVAESLRFLATPRTYTLRSRADQRRTPFCARFQPGEQATRMDLWSEDPIPIPAFCSVYLSQCGSDHRRLVPNVCRVCRLPRETFLCPGERRE